MTADRSLAERCGLGEPVPARLNAFTNRDLGVSAGASLGVGGGLVLSAAGDVASRSDFGELPGDMGLS